MEMGDSHLQSLNHADHDTSLQLQTHLASLCSRTRMQHAVRSLHDFDSQVAWGILTKNRASMLRFCRVVIKCIVPCLTVSYIALLEYSCTAEHLADRTSKAHGDVGNQSAGQSRGDSSVHIWNDYEATTKIEAINYVSSVFYYLPQLKSKVPGSTRFLVTWSKCELSTQAPPLSTFSLTAFAGNAVALHDRRLAISLLLEFHCMLRTGDLFKIRNMYFSLMEQRCRGIVVLPETKSVEPAASSETVDIFDAYLARMLACVCRNLAPAEFLVGCSPAAFQARLAPLVPKLDSQTAAGTLTASSAIELPHISVCSTVNWIAPWSEEGEHPPRAG